MTSLLLEEPECPHFSAALAFAVHFLVTPRLNQPVANESCCSGVSGRVLYRGRHDESSPSVCAFDPQMLYLTHLFPRIPEISCQSTS